jgi:hypothetical protein
MRRRSPLDEARIRGGRDDGRPSEDDIAKKRLGQQGVPGQPDKPEPLSQDELQNPRPLDPGHTS